MIHGGSDVSQALFKKAIHEEWISDYESGLNDTFYEPTIDAILSCLNPSEDISVIDAGCGDASKYGNSALANSIDLRREDLCALTFDDGAFDCVLCWGVLMHIPLVETAVQELARVTRRKGFLVIQESNMRSIQSASQRSLMRLLRKDMSAMKITGRGVESGGRRRMAFY
jgi:SAM-dependent methyltransferase